jgi:hypothetical protein
VPLPVDSDSSSNSFLQPASVGKVNVSSTSTGKTQGPTVTSATPSITAQSSNGRHTNNSSGSKSGHSQTSTQHRHLSKAPQVKALNRPMIIVDEKKEVQGMSMFELTKEPENNYTYVTSMEAPKLFGNIKDLDGKNSRNNAVSHHVLIYILFILY